MESPGSGRAGEFDLPAPEDGAGTGSPGENGPEAFPPVRMAAG